MKASIERSAAAEKWRSIDQLAVALILATCTAICAGCGDARPERVPVSGVVLLDGQPLGEGVVRVLPSSGRSAFGQIQPDGHFTLSTYEAGDGCILGDHSVEVVAIRPTLETMSAGDRPRGPQWLAPERYADFRTSELKLRINGPTDSVNIELHSNKQKTAEIKGEHHADQSPGDSQIPRQNSDGALRTESLRVARRNS